MSADIVRLWKDPDARVSGVDPAHPAGAIELAAPAHVGGNGSGALFSFGCCGTHWIEGCTAVCTASYCSQFGCAADPADAFGALSGGCCMADV